MTILLALSNMAQVHMEEEARCSPFEEALSEA